MPYRLKRGRVYFHCQWWMNKGHVIDCIFSFLREVSPPLLLSKRSNIPPSKNSDFFPYYNFGSWKLIYEFRLVKRQRAEIEFFAVVSEMHMFFYGLWFLRFYGFSTHGKCDIKVGQGLTWEMVRKHFLLFQVFVVDFLYNSLGDAMKMQFWNNFEFFFYSSFFLSFFLWAYHYY